LARADCEENGVKASHNAVEKAWRKYRKNVEFSRICEIRAKQVLGMFHDMSADASSNKQLEYVINLARKFGQNEV
jgi:hypothetical protein